MPESLFNKVAGLYPEILFKVQTTAWIFFNEYCKIFRSVFLTEHVQRLLVIFRKLDIQTSNSKQIYSLDQYCRNAIFDE